MLIALASPRVATSIDEGLDKIKQLVAQGQTLEQVQAAVGDPAPSEAPSGNGGPRFAAYSEVVYRELTKK